MLAMAGNGRKSFIIRCDTHSLRTSSAPIGCMLLTAADHSRLTHRARLSSANVSIPKMASSACR